MSRSPSYSIGNCFILCSNERPCPICRCRRTAHIVVNWIVPGSRHLSSGKGCTEALRGRSLGVRREEARRHPYTSSLTAKLNSGGDICIVGQGWGHQLPSGEIEAAAGSHTSSQGCWAWAWALLLLGVDGVIVVIRRLGQGWGGWSSCC